MKSIASVTIPQLPPLLANKRGHWATMYQHKKKWKEITIFYLARFAPKKPHQKIKAILTRYSSVEPDFDNGVSSWKPIIDGIVDVGFIPDDKGRHFEAEYRWEKASPKGGKIMIELFLEGA